MITSSPLLLHRPGAVEAEGVDAGVAMHYGEPLPEQRALEAGEAVVDLSHRGVVRVSGPDRLRWLHSMTTQQLVDLAPFTSTESLVLSPHGHIEHDLHLVDDGEATWITVEPGTAPALVQWLESMRFMLDVRVEDLTTDYGVLGEPAAGETGDAERALGALAWVDPWPALGADTAAYSSIDLHPATGRAWRELIVPRDRLDEAVGDRRLAGSWAAEALRIAAWRPRHLLDTDHRTIPHELDWLRTAVHLHKGCYRGQETIARVHNLGRPPRRLVFLDLDGSEHSLPRHNDPVRVPGQDRPVGSLMSVARHHESGPIGLALIKRNVPVEATLEIEGIAAAQTVIVAP